MDFEIQIKELLGQQKNSEKITDFLKRLEIIYTEKVSNGPTFHIEVKTFSDAEYYNIRSFGLSLCFDKVTRKSLTGEKKTIEELGAIHIFKSQSGYATFPLKLSHRIDLNWRARDVVSNLGEPQKKTGGGSSPVSITYTNCDPKLEIDFLSGNWDDPFNKIGSVIFFN